MRQRSHILTVAVVVMVGGSFARAQAPAERPPPAERPSEEEEELEVPAAGSPGAEPASPPPAAPPAAPPPRVERDEEEARAWQAATAARLGALEGRLGTVESIAKSAPPPRPVAEVGAEEPPGPDVGEAGVAVLRRPGLAITGYAQGQYLTSAASQDELVQGGGYLNEDQFIVRRARLRADRRWRFAALAVEIDGNTQVGLGFGLRRAEASLVWDQPGSSLPPVILTAGMFFLPFGFDLPASARTQLFLERSLGSSAMFPGQADIGIRLAGAWRFLRYAVALVNGEPVTETAALAFRGDPNAAKDVVGRFGADVPAAPWLRVTGGVSFLEGKGFHRGVQATKSGTVWVDLNENGQIDLGEVMAVPGTPATPSTNFRHWAVGADLRIELRSALGLTHLAAEVVVSSNLDRGLFGNDPIVTGFDVRQLGYYAWIIQDLFTWGFAGFRLDLYNPHLDATDSRAGQLLPASQTITVLSPLLGVRLGHRSRFSVQYDRTIDNLARDPIGVPTDLANDRLIARLQVDL